MNAQDDTFFRKFSENLDCNLVVKNISQTMEEKDVSDILSQFYEVKCISMSTKSNLFQTFKYAFVSFFEPEHATAVLENLNNYEIRGSKWKVEKYCKSLNYVESLNF